jgi:hypothetical protein
MTLLLQPSKTVKAELLAAIREADAYAGTDPVDVSRAHGDWDREDFDGKLWHDENGVTPMSDGSLIPCPYCRVRRLKRAYGVALCMESPP